ncbi:MAG TPA: polyprenol monophosphomannose synthase [Thermoanaerobaculia bacterium]
MKEIIPPLFDSRARPQVSIYVATEPTLLVVPTFNESSNIGELIERFFTYVQNVHLLVVDDHSPDGTADIVEGLQQKYPNLLLLRRTGEKGLGRAYLAGISTGLEKQFQIIGTMDADLSHDPAYLPLMLTMIESADVVIGSRYIRDGGTINWQIRRVLLSWLANKYAAKLLRIPAHDLTSGYRLYRRGTIERLQLKSMKSTGYSFLVELLYRAHATGAKIAESPIVFYDRTMGASKLRSREIYIGALNLFLLRLLKKTIRS